jgi:hypothetical protein
MAVRPGKPNSIHLAEFSQPSLEEVPGGRGVLGKNGELMMVSITGSDRKQCVLRSRAAGVTTWPTNDC